MAEKVYEGIDKRDSSPFAIKIEPQYSALSKEATITQKFCGQGMLGVTEFLCMP